MRLTIHCNSIIRRPQRPSSSFLSSRFRDEDILKRILVARDLNLDLAYKQWEVRGGGEEAAIAVEGDFERICVESDDDWFVVGMMCDRPCFIGAPPSSPKTVTKERVQR